MPKGLIFRLLVMFVAAVVASLYFRREAAAPARPDAASEAMPRIETDAELRRDDRAAALDPSAPPLVVDEAPRAPADWAPVPGARIGPCSVTHVADGDTLNVRCGARKERVRLLQVDTPERDEPLYEEASHALEALIAERAVELELGVVEERDDHGRLLAYVHAGGENLNLALIRDGWSPYFDRYGAGRYPREFAEAERAAREAKRGIWRVE
jgi:endonuclease YncB( thermonuclease family)